MKGGIIYKAGSTGFFFLFSLIVLGFCIFMSITDGGIAMYIAAAFFFLLTLVLFLSVLGKFKSKNSDKNKKHGRAVKV